MINQRKSDHCFNCSAPLKNEDDFCRKCGQENRDKIVSLKVIISDFLGDYFTFDSKLFRSIFPLIFKPGFLTNEYNAGKRTRYIPPLRMYIFISFIYFFVIGIMGETYEEYRKEKEKEIASKDTIVSDTLKGIYFSDNNVNINIGAGNKKFSIKNLKEVLGSDEKMNIFLENLKLEKTKLNKFLARTFIAQAIKLKEQRDGFTSYFFRNISIMIFFLMPLFAAVLKLFYLRRKKFYIEHLVFSFHLHSFSFFIFTLSSLYENKWLDTAAFLLIAIYLFVAMRKVYKQSWWKTALKYFSALLSYLLCLVVCMLGTMVFTFLFF